MRRGFAFVLIFLAGIAAQAAELISIPAGKVEAIWLTPVTKAEAKKAKPKYVRVGGFQSMLAPVTVGEFRKFLSANPKWQKNNANNLFVDQHYLTSIESAQENQPVTYVTWFAARAFCDAQGMRLPTVNEWEYMAAASETKRDANRNPKFLKRILEWYGEPYGAQLKPVQSIYKNVYGAWDLHGLIWEWVEDFNSTFVTGESREDSSFNKDMFCGAGAMGSADKVNYAAFMRFAFRSGLKGKSSVWNLGFRCVK